MLHAVEIGIPTRKFRRLTRIAFLTPFFFGWNQRRREGKRVFLGQQRQNRPQHMIHDGNLPTDVGVVIGTGEIHRQLRSRQEKQIVDPRQQQIKLVGHGVFKVSKTAIEAKDDGIA